MDQEVVNKIVCNNCFIETSSSSSVHLQLSASEIEILFEIAFLSHRNAPPILMGTPSSNHRDVIKDSIRHPRSCHPL